MMLDELKKELSAWEAEDRKGLLQALRKMAWVDSNINTCIREYNIKFQGMILDEKLRIAIENKAEDAVVRDIFDKIARWKRNETLAVVGYE